MGVKKMAEENGPEVAIRKLVQTFGVTGYVMLNKNGIPVQYHGMDDDRAVLMGGIFSELALAAQHFCQQSKTWDPHGEEDMEGLTSLRIRTHKNEYVICPEDGYTLIVEHNPNWDPSMAPVIVEDAKEDEGDDE